jgi:hypothetical protein
MSTIQCDCSVEDGELPRVARCKERMARKPHKCCECCEDIVPGQRYRYESGIDCEGSAYDYKTCLPCARIRDRYCPRGWLWGELADTIAECIGFDYRRLPDDDDDDGD